MKITIVRMHLMAAALVAAAWPMAASAGADQSTAQKATEDGQCLASYYQGSNGALLTGYSQKAARENAIISWGVRVTASVGPLYSDWDRAVDRSFSCVKKGKLIKCTARARPCKSK